jgi:hypothetical protein
LQTKDIRRREGTQNRLTPPPCPGAAGYAPDPVMKSRKKIPRETLETKNLLSFPSHV